MGGRICAFVIGDRLSILHLNAAPKAGLPTLNTFVQMVRQLLHDLPAFGQVLRFVVAARRMLRLVRRLALARLRVPPEFTQQRMGHMAKALVGQLALVSSADQ